MDHNGKAVLASAVVTALATIVLFFLPALVPLEEFKLFLYETLGVWSFGNPFAQLRLLGGIPGGFVGGYFARDHFGNTSRDASMKVAIYGVLLGLLLVWATYVLYNVANAVFVYGTFPPPMYVIVITPIILALPLFPTYLLEGLIFGVFGWLTSNLREEPGQ